MTNDNKKILDQVKGIVSQKKSVTKKNIKDLIQSDEEKLIKKEIDKWINENAEEVAKKIIAEQIKKIFK
tara:strand:+ start:209 stop:415 length:207 start_codon:yes stop_codon:yes gene_type:complete